MKLRSDSLIVLAGIGVLCFVVIGCSMILWSQYSDQNNRVDCNSTTLRTFIARSVAGTPERLALREVIRAQHVEIRELLDSKNPHIDPLKVENDYQSWEDSIAAADRLRKAKGDVELSRQGCDK